METKEKIEIILEFIKDEIQKAGRTGAVVGVSGGIDSAVCLYLCEKALGKENVYPLFMPVGDAADLTGSVEKLCDKIGLNPEILNLKELMDDYRKLAGPATKMQAGNFSARLRTALLYSKAEATGSLVVNTSNLSESMVGYFTKWGDEAGDISPIGELYKSEVYKIAEELGIPSEIIEAEPTAGFFDGQTDAGELGMKYKQLDLILESLKSGNLENLAQEDIKRVKNLIEKSAHKRNKIPVPGLER